MALQSKTGHVRKICGCKQWKTCAHPWHVDYREGKELGPDGKVRVKGIRCLLSKLVGREPTDFTDAKAEARRAIVAWQAGLDAKSLIPLDAPTLAQVLDAYAARPGGSPITYQKGPITKAVVNGKAFGDWKAAEVTRDMVEQFRRTRTTVGGNRNLALLRAAFNWAVLGGLVAGSPFKVGHVSAIKLSREEPRTRRLQPGEEEKLLVHAKAIGDLIVAGLETGCRLGELLSLQWSQVRSELFLPEGKTKAKKPRRVPVSTVLRKVLDGRRNDPAGEPLPPEAYVFGDAVGRRRVSIRGAWVRACTRAGIVGLHFHDLRREAGSRWMDAGVPLSVIQRWLGHHNISQTSTYLAATGGGDADAMERFERASGRLTQVDANTVKGGPETTSTDPEASEKSNENHTIH